MDLKEDFNRRRKKQSRGLLEGFLKIRKRRNDALLLVSEAIHLDCKLPLLLCLRLLIGCLRCRSRH